MHNVLPSVDGTRDGQQYACVGHFVTRAERARRKSFWFRVQLRCDALGLSHNAFGRKVGVTTGPVTEWFSQLRMPRGEYLMRFPAVLKCDGHWLLTGDGSPRQRY